MLIHPSSGACDLFIELFHGLYCSGTMCVGVTLWFGWGGVVSGCSLQQISRKLLRMGVLTSETCWALNNWNKRASDIKLVSLYSTIKMMHGPINIRFTELVFCVADRIPTDRVQLLSTTIRCVLVHRGLLNRECKTKPRTQTPELSHSARPA